MKTYTVAELIKALQSLPQDLPVLDDCHEGVESVSILEDDCPWLPNKYVILKTTTYDMN